ncbi:MAG TPA: hypothetical protein VLV50_07715 [Stellaceae bacterium]|nr:hypothetical protein [Stellaceae bacterium]
MDDVSLIFASPLGVSVFFYVAVASVVGLGILVSWVNEAPLRRRKRWFRLTARPVVRQAATLPIPLIPSD